MMYRAGQGAGSLQVILITMEFYDREQDVQSLEELYRQCERGNGKISVRPEEKATDQYRGEGVFRKEHDYVMEVVGLAKYLIA
ncbi:MAG: hypothetical protein ACLFMZ_11200 [Spirochaetaceae bacterium]